MGNLMHVVHLVDKFRDGGIHGGLSTVVSEETRALVARGQRMTVIARRFDRAIPLQETLDGVDIIRFDSSNALDTFMQVREIVQRLTATRTIHVIHSHMATIDLAAIHFLPNTIPVVRSFHGDWPQEVWAEKQDQQRSKLAYVKDQAKRALQERIERRSMARAEHIVVLSNFSKNYVMHKYKRKAEDISIIAPGIDVKRFHPSNDRTALRQELGLPETATIVLFTGRMIAWKGPQRIIAAFAQIADQQPDAVLVLVGKGNLEGTLRAQVRELGIEHCVIFAGFQHERMPQYYAAADVMVVASTREETFGMVTIEALASGCPVLGSPFGATPEILNAIDSRLVMQSASITDIVAGLNRFFSESWGTELQADKLHHAVTTTCSWDRHTDALLALYQRSSIASRQTQKEAR